MIVGRSAGTNSRGSGLESRKARHRSGHPAIQSAGTVTCAPARDQAVHAKRQKFSGSVATSTGATTMVERKELFHTVNRGRRQWTSAPPNPGAGNRTSALPMLALVAVSAAAAADSVRQEPDQRTSRNYKSIAVRSAPPFRQNIVQMYAKKVLLPLAFLPIPSMFVVAPSNLVQWVYCKPMRKFSHGQNDGPPWLNGR